ncbi:hypothetical protein BY996DRAFT_6428923 [Phakopsora pachyrhizi]|nr:hypothetical protein BY996DRAFT_6428923 [Phakopsora pachyrhizi]
MGAHNWKLVFRQGKTSDDQDGDKSVICSEEGVRDAESSVDGPIKLVGEQIRLSSDGEEFESQSGWIFHGSKLRGYQSNSYSTYSSCRGRSNSDNLRPNSSPTQLVPNLSWSGSTGFLSGKTKPKMKELVPTQRPVKEGDPPPSTSPALITTEAKVSEAPIILLIVLLL